MVDRPTAFGVHQGVEVWMLAVQKLVGGETVEAEQPIRLVEPVFP